MQTQPMDNSQPLADGFNFTPIFQNRRVRLRLSPEDLGKASGRGVGMRGIITDLDTGTRYKVYGRACSLPRCQCDAEIKEA